MKHASGWSGAIFLITLMAAVSTATAADTMYRWVDADGNVNYSDLPPPAGARDTKSLNERLPISEPDSESASEAASDTETEVDAEEEFQERRKARAKAATKASEEAATAVLTEQNCIEAQADVLATTNPPGGRLRERNREGVLVYLTDEQLEQRKREAHEDVKKWCNS